jgi:8-oxo-dGTP diphosphatase
MPWEAGLSRQRLSLKTNGKPHITRGNSGGQMGKLIHVVAGVISDNNGRVLLTQRPAGKHLAGLWEFPGGKCEDGEAPEEALRRELHEEIGIDTKIVERLISIPWHYPEKSILLDVHRILNYSGDPHGREHQALQWVLPKDLTAIEMPDADKPVIAALRLPQYYVITPDPFGDEAEFLRNFQTLLNEGWKFIQLRSKKLPDQALRSLVMRARDLAAKVDAQIILNGHTEIARELDLAGVHLPAKDLMACHARPLGSDSWVGASCHNENELSHATAIGVDFATLGPVHPTTSHPNAPTLGWQRFAELCSSAQCPVYALGGLTQSDMKQAILAGAQGIAGISAFWPK